MKIINREQFFKTPKNTVYCKYSELAIYGDLCIKTSDKDKIDWIFAPLTGAIDVQNSVEFANKMIEYEESGKEFEFDLECTQRDGLYDEEQLFAIFSKKDIKKLIDKLNSVL